MHNNINNSPIDKPSNLKLTEHRKSWIVDLVRTYSEQIGIIKKDVPSVVFTRKEVHAMPIELTRGRRSATHKYRGVCYTSAKTIFIHVKRHRSFQELRHTIIHELVHYRFGYLRHGQRFEDRINRILKGKRYGFRNLYAEPTPGVQQSGQDKAPPHQGGNHIQVN